MSTLLFLLIIVLFLSSLIGVVLPFIPDMIPLWLGVLVYHYFSKMEGLGLDFWIVLIVVTLLVLGADFISNAYFIKKYGGSRISIIAAMMGIIAGTMIAGPPGIVAGPFVGVFILEYLRSKDSKNSMKIASATVIAFLGSSVAKILLQLFIIALFIFEVI